MPNHVENYLKIASNKGSVMPVLDFIAGGNGPIDFNNIIPYPEKYRAADEASATAQKERPTEYETWPDDGYNHGGYEWCVENWYTKWNAYNISIVENKYNDTVVIRFNTAWRPPVPVIIELARMFPEYDFCLEYYEAGAGYSGSMYLSEGVVKHDFSGEYCGFRGG